VNSNKLLIRLQIEVGICVVLVTRSTRLAPTLHVEDPPGLVVCGKQHIYILTIHGCFSYTTSPGLWGCKYAKKQSQWKSLFSFTMLFFIYAKTLVLSLKDSEKILQNINLKVLQQCQTYQR